MQLTRETRMVSLLAQDVVAIFTIFFLPFLLGGSVSAQDITPMVNVYCSDSNDSAPNFQYSVHNLLSKLNSESSVAGFYEGSIGENPDQVYGLYLCIGDTNQQLCHSCVQNGTATIVKECPYEIWAVVWYDKCLIRYSNESFFGMWDISVAVQSFLCNGADITDVSVASFTQVVNNTLNLIAARAANGDQFGRKFATQKVTVSSSLTLYALGQCTTDLSTSDCRLCLTECIDYLINSYCIGKEGGRMFYRTNCFVRYEIYPFFDQTVVAAPGPAPVPAPGPASAPAHAPAFTTSPSGEKKKISKAEITGIAAAAIASLLLIGTFFFFHLKRKAKKSHNTLNAETQSVNIEHLTADSLQYDWSTLQAATNNFSHNNRIGKGGFGVVYKGILENGQEIAVKRLLTSSDQGVAEFKNEVVLVAKLQHKNLVRLLGFCLAWEEQLLVFEFVPNKSLNYFLFNLEKRVQLDWKTHYEIIRGIARGLLYLHGDSRLKIIHRDLKASNILLDADMNPKISDFGLARLVGVDQSLNETERVAGTFGYMAPEYLLYGQFSVKSDVYSFGVLILEIISGKKVRNLHQLDMAEHLLIDAWKHWRNGKVLEFVDQTLEISHCSVDEIMGCIQLGLLCVQQDIDKRPTMALVIHMLRVDSFNNLPVPQQPTFFPSNNMELSSSSVKQGQGSYSSIPGSNSMKSSSTEITLTDPNRAN